MGTIQPVRTTQTIVFSGFQYHAYIRVQVESTGGCRPILTGEGSRRLSLALPLLLLALIQPPAKLMVRIFRPVLPMSGRSSSNPVGPRNRGPVRGASALPFDGLQANLNHDSQPL